MVDYSAVIRSRIRPFTPSPAAFDSTPPVVACRCCGAVMEAKPWRELNDWLLTCRGGCRLHDQTFAASRYATADLSKYKHRRRKR